VTKVLWLAISAIASLSFFAGCSSAYTVLHEGQKLDSEPMTSRPGTVYDSQLKVKLAGAEAEIRMNNKETFKGMDFFIRNDSLAWLSVGNNMSHCVAISDVSSIIKKNSGGGAIKGFFIGTLGGVATGFLVASGPEIAVILTVTGAVAGTIIGVANGPRDEYQFDHYLIPEHRKRE
jgi:hypothetical protein